MAYQEIVEKFKKHIEESDILDDEDVHHEFVSGMHGRKLDFDAIPDDSPLFAEWIDVVTACIQELYPDKLNNVVLVSVANGTNRVVPLVAKKLGSKSTYLLTEKSSPKSAKLTPEAEEKMQKLTSSLFVVLEDVGTKGTTSASVVQSLRAAGASDIEVINTWERRDKMEELDAINAPHYAIIKESLATYSPEECKSNGLCAAGAKFIEHAK